MFRLRLRRILGYYIDYQEIPPELDMPTEPEEIIASCTRRFQSALADATTAEVKELLESIR